MRPSLGAQGNEGSEQGRFINVRVGKGRQPAPPFTAVPECGQPEGRAPKQEIEECSAEIQARRRGSQALMGHHTHTLAGL